MGFNTNKKMTKAEMQFVAEEAAKISGTAVAYEGEILYFVTGTGNTDGGDGTIAKLQQDVSDLKGSALASVNTIGDGLKVSDGELSTDCATTSETSTAVSGVLGSQ